jgi:hypothetical protein
LDGWLAVTPEHGHDLGRGACGLVLAVILGIEFVGVADDLFFDGQGAHVPNRQGQFLALNIPGTEPDPDVPFAYQGMPVETSAFQ